MAKAASAITYFFLVKNTDKGAEQSSARSKQEQAAVSRGVKEEGGDCTLYATTGGAYDYVSVVTGISPEAAIKIAMQIEQGGRVKVTLLGGLPIRK